MTTAIKEAKEILESTEKFKIELGLDRITKILKLLDNPQNNYKIFHIAGTNGKGSTSKILNDILIEEYKKCSIGFFSSPHIFNYEERIKINNEDIPKNTFDELVENINSLALKNNIDLTEFELLTAVAFYYFYIKKADFVILETGLGGAFDATNVVLEPLCSIITTIDFDHKERLGDTIEKIAFQKAGIIKKNCPVVVSKDNLGFETIKKQALKMNSELFEAQKLTKSDKKVIIEGKKYDFNLLGSYQLENLSLALAALNASKIKIKDENLKTALKNVNWKFRLEYDEKKNILIDCAHNPQGIKSLRDFLDEEFKNTKKTIFFGCLKNKDYEKMLETLITKDDDFYFVEFNYKNSLKFDQLPKKYQKKRLNETEVLKLIKKDKNLKVIAGSIYMLNRIFNKCNLTT